MEPVILLASASPRRSELLQQIGVPHQVAPAHIDEQPLAGETPAQYVARLSLEKARAGYDKSTLKLPALGSDTAVICDELILGKPRDEEDAVTTLMRLSGRSHHVLSGVAVYTPEQQRVEVVSTEVRFRTLTETECRRYWASGEPADKAGSYGIQGLGAVFVTSINGSYSSVVGLPLAETAAILNTFDIAAWQRD
ncbi:Maf family protein [Marinobacterium jannaschii]|uniref:Maf family protein n=1 Tax=Marinobacterium jannaschii TaxID=64970 RepID=UPI00048297E0|nr:Maf family protein [Marinobacterium jannaschii]